MRYNIQNLLHMELEPVGIFYCDKAPEHALSLRSDRRSCVADMLMGAARGKTIIMTEETCSCAGGAVGLGFGDAFTQRNHPTRYLLSTGMAEVPEGEEVKLPPHMQEGERFFADPCVADVWKSDLPFGAACHSLMYALDQAKKDNPKMVLGYFDVSQRAKIPANLLTVTFPYSLFVRFEEDADKGCLSSHAWIDLMEKRAKQAR